MQIGNLQPARGPRRAAAFQWIRVVIILSLAASGAFAVSLTTEDQGSSDEIAASTQAATDMARVPEHPAPAPMVAAQMASADPGAADLAAAQALVTGVSAPMTEEAHPVDAVAAAEAAPQNDAAVISPGQALDSSSHEMQQASAGEPPASPEMTGAVGDAGSAVDAEADKELIDLNTASFEQLNTMPNAGPIGRAIIRGRPYASVEELVTRKILRRSVYEKVKDQVTVQ